MKYCTNCGAPSEDTAKFCIQCGSPIASAENITPVAEDPVHTDNEPTPATPAPEAPVSYSYEPKNEKKADSSYTYNYGSSTQSSAPNYNNTPNTGESFHKLITERSIPVALILSIVTCGLYSIYWMIMLNDEVNSLANEPDAPSGGIVFLLTLVTCGFYSIYWLYKMGERCDRIKGVDGNSNILYLILGLLGFGVISYCLMQDTINKAV